MDTYIFIIVLFRLLFLILQGSFNDTYVYTYMQKHASYVCTMTYTTHILFWILFFSPYFSLAINF